MDNYSPELGTPISELETPCFIVDLDALEHNFKVVAETYHNTACKMREHTKNIKSPRLARMQMDVGGTNGGVCTAKVAEAEVMILGGIDDILIPNQVVTRDKITRLCSLAREGDIKVTVDSVDNVQAISDVASVHGVTVGILIEVDTSMGRAGVRTIETGLEIAKLAQELPGIAFRGVMSHQSVMGHGTDRKSRSMAARDYIGQCMAVVDAIKAEGIPVEIVSSGETFNYNIAPEIPGVTEVEGGSYALMSTGYSYMTEFRYAGKILGTVVSRPRDDIAIGDVGIHCISGPSGTLPTIDGIDGVEVESIHETHIVLRTNGTPMSVTDRFLLIPGHQDMVPNRWDQYVAVREGLVEDIWDIPGRGCYH